VCQMCAKLDWFVKGNPLSSGRGGQLIARHVPPKFRLHFVGALFAHLPMHDIARLAIRRLELADAGSAFWSSAHGRRHDRIKDLFFEDDGVHTGKDHIAVVSAHKNVSKDIVRDTPDNGNQPIM
jgi:hypothetical protein